MATTLWPPTGAGGNSPQGARADFSLTDKYDRESGLIYLTGIQALVRLPLDQHRADKRRGLHTGTFISGYRGSPLGGFDAELERNRSRLDAHHVVHQPGLNEELAATAVFGSQLATTVPGARYDGVLGMWYGKGPGVDRTGETAASTAFAGVLLGAQRTHADGADALQAAVSLVRRTGHRGRRMGPPGVLEEPRPVAGTRSG